MWSGSSTFMTTQQHTLGMPYAKKVTHTPVFIVGGESPQGDGDPFIRGIQQTVVGGLPLQGRAETMTDVVERLPRHPKLPYEHVVIKARNNIIPPVLCVCGCAHTFCLLMAFMIACKVKVPLNFCFLAMLC